MTDHNDGSGASQPMARYPEILQDLIQRARVTADHFTWSFSEGMPDLDPKTALTCAPQIQFLLNLKENWRAEFPAKMRFPDDWMPKESDVVSWAKPYDFKAEMAIWLHGIGDALSPMSQTETISRHFNPTSFEPDFLLAVPTHHIDLGDGFPPAEKALGMDVEHSLEHFKPIVFYGGEERDAEAAISKAFMCIPGCWLRCAPLFEFPHNMMASPSPFIEFALLLNTIGASRGLEVSRMRHRRVTLTHPALVVGIKGPTLWPTSLAHSPPLERPSSIKEAIQNLAAAVQPSLIAHLLNWQLRLEQMPDRCTPGDLGPPAWFMVFGVIYDSERIVIVAHIPFISIEHSENSEKPIDYPRRRFSYLSCVVDSIPFAPVPATARLSEPWCLDRFRAAFALFTIQRHAFRLASLWESVVWPSEIALAEAALDREYLGPTPTPSEDGDALPQYVIELEEQRLTLAEQQEELDEEIQERDVHAREILPDILQWIGHVAGNEASPYGVCL